MYISCANVNLELMSKVVLLSWSLELNPRSDTRNTEVFSEEIQNTIALNILLLI